MPTDQIKVEDFDKNVLKKLITKLGNNVCVDGTCNCCTLNSKIGPYLEFLNSPEVLTAMVMKELHPSTLIIVGFDLCLAYLDVMKLKELEESRKKSN